MELSLLNTTPNEDLFDNGSDDEHEWRKEIKELKAFRADFEQDSVDSTELNDEHKEFSVLNVILSCSELSSSADNVLIMNRAMIYMLRQMKSQVLERLRKNIDEQAALRDEIKYMKSSSKGNVSNASFLKCGMPYFKVRNGWKQPPNLYCEQHKKLDYASPDSYFRNSYCWSQKDNKDLKKLVIESTTETKLIELEKKVRLNTRSGGSKNGLQEISKQIEKLKQKDGMEINSVDVDWMRVSCNLGSMFTPSECQIQWSCFVDPKINNTKWTYEEKIRLFAFVAENDFQSWDKIARQHGTGRTGLQCCIMFHRNISEPAKRCSPAENEKLIALFDCYKSKTRPCTKISFFMDCNVYECKARLKYLKLQLKNNAPSSDPRNICKGDLKVSYDHAPRNIRNRLTAKHGRLQSDCNFSSDEDYLVLEAVVNHGKQWDVVAEAVPGRNEWEVKERYEKLLIFAKDVLRSIDRSSSKSTLDLLPTQLKSNAGYNVWSILQLFWEPSNANVASTLCGLPFGDKMSAPTQQLLKILEFGHKNVYGPRYAVPRTEDQKHKMVKTMSVISQLLNLSFTSNQVIENLKKHAQGTTRSNKINYPESMVLHLENISSPTLSPLILRSLIPPNLLTLLGARVLSSVRGLLYSQAELSLPIPMTIMNRNVAIEQRLSPIESKERLKNRMFSIFFLSLCMAKIPQFVGQYDKMTAPRNSAKNKRKMSKLQMKRNLRKICCKRWNKTDEQLEASKSKVNSPKKKTKNVRTKRNASPPSPSKPKKAKMIRVTRSTGKPVSVEVIND